MSKQQPEVWKEKLIEAMTKTLGVVTPACKMVGISRDRFYTYYNEDEEFKRKIDDIQNVQMDFVENQLFSKIKAGSERSIIFYMKHKGKTRGYKEGLDITSDGKEIGGEIKIKFIDGNRSDQGPEEND